MNRVREVTRTGSGLNLRVSASGVAGFAITELLSKLTCDATPEFRDDDHDAVVQVVRESACDSVYIMLLGCLPTLSLPLQPSLLTL